MNTRNADRDPLRDLLAGMMDPMTTTTMDAYGAALATVGSMRESAARALRTVVGADSDSILASRIADAMNSTALGGSKITTFWAASGHTATESVRQLTGQSMGGASMLVAAALHAQVLAGGDVTEGTVIALAERAAAWDRGRAFGEATAKAHA